MDTQSSGGGSDMHSHDGMNKHCEHCCGHHRGGRIVRVLVFIVFFALVFALVSGFFGGRMGWHMGGFDRGYNMMGYRTGYVDDGTSVFGEITKIEGAQITITDNGGASQVVVSSANTQITDGTNELILSDLVAGDRISVVGVKEDGKLSARYIEVTGLK